MDGLPYQMGILSVLPVFKNSGGLPVDVVVRLRLVLSDSIGFATGCGGLMFFESLTQLSTSLSNVGFSTFTTRDLINYAGFSYWLWGPLAKQVTS